MHYVNTLSYCYNYSITISINTIIYNWHPKNSSFLNYAIQKEIEAHAIVILPEKYKHSIINMFYFCIVKFNGTVNTI